MTDIEALRAKMREAGWSVAVHNDYRLNGVPHTFWLWTHPNGRWVKGEGQTDAEALLQCDDAAANVKALDAEITRLREDLDRVTGERDGARARFNDIDLCQNAQAPCEWSLTLIERINAAEAALAKRDEEVARLRDAVQAVTAATSSYLPPDGIDAQECLNRIIGATDNPDINAIMEAANGRS